jgi:hypothetical protein
MSLSVKRVSKLAYALMTCGIAINAAAQNMDRVSTWMEGVWSDAVSDLSR